MMTNRIASLRELLNFREKGKKFAWKSSVSKILKLPFSGHETLLGSVASQQRNLVA